MPTSTLRSVDRKGLCAPLLRHEVFHPALEGREGDEYSQFGEDGLIEAVFELIGTTNKWCFEVGAADGIYYSNTKRLREAGWEAVLIESDEAKARKLIAACAPLENEHAICAHVDAETRLDDIFVFRHVPKDMDLGVIDVDGQDYWVWYDLAVCVPRVMLVEFDPNRPHDTVLPFIPERGKTGQAGLQPILALGESKGYRKIAITAVNVLFVRSELWPT